MATLLKSLPSETVERLRLLARPTEDVHWVEPLQKRHGWLVANRGYLALERALGRQEMVELLDALGLKPPLSPALQRDALITAASVYLNTDETTAASATHRDYLRLDGLRLHRPPQRLARCSRPDAESRAGDHQEMGRACLRDAHLLAGQCRD
jgi:hypothetical protein